MSWRHEPGVFGVIARRVPYLAPRRAAAELERLGWAEPSRYADFGTEIMVYGPRDAAELDLVGESLAFARG